MRYLGPATSLDGKTVPADGLPVNYSAAQVRSMRDHGHRFDTDDTERVVKPTPAQVNDAVIGDSAEADLDKAVKATVKETVADKK